MSATHDEIDSPRPAGPRQAGSRLEWRKPMIGFAAVVASLLLLGIGSAQPASSPSPPSAPVARALVKVVVMGTFPESLLKPVETALEQELAVEVERIDGVALPAFAYYPPRRRYRAERLLDFLNQHLRGEPRSTRVLGLTTVDISTTNGRYRDWGIFGLGEIGGRSCVVSSFRLGRGAAKRDQSLRQFRVATTAVHEVGHTLGLQHCTEPRCLMRDAEGSIETVDTSDGHLGPRCMARLERHAPKTER